MSQDKTEPPETADERAKGRYRKLEARTWGDRRFCALSPIPACGQGLFLFLTLGPFTSPVPGLFRAGRAAMAEALGWELEDFDKAFQEVFAQGMAKADWKARVVWLPNAIKHNKPTSPNVVKSWASEFDLIPECALKAEAFEVLKASIHAAGEAYGKAFDESLGKAFEKAFAKTIGNQEQEQEQLKEITPLPPKGGEGAVSVPPTSPPTTAKKRQRREMVLSGQGAELFDRFYAAYPRKVGKKQAMAEFLRINPSAELVDTMVGAIKAQGLAQVMRDRGDRFVPHPSTWLHGERWSDEVPGGVSEFNGKEVIGSTYGRDPQGNGVSL